MSREDLYRGLSKVAWAFVFLHVNLNLGTINLLPGWAGCLLIWRAIPLLAGERRDLALLKPFCLGLGLWSLAGWATELFGFSLGDRFYPLDLVVGVVSLYFSFQLLTDLAALAGTCQPEGWTLDRNLRTCRGIITVARVFFFLPLSWEGDILTIISALLAVFMLIVTLFMIYYLFSLRKCLAAELQ